MDCVKWECEECGRPLDVFKAGRPSRYCSSACRQRAYRRRKAVKLPDDMLAARRWVAADGKRPVMVDGSPASSTRSETWTDHSSVERNPFGFMLGAGFACIDLDYCLNQRGRPYPWAQEIIKSAPGAYVERSVSGRGLHIFGLLPEGPGKRVGRVEYYSTARFIRMTGKVYRPGELVALSPAVKTIQRLHKAGEIPERTKARE